SHLFAALRVVSLRLNPFPLRLNFCFKAGMYRLKPAIFLLIILMTFLACDGLKESMSKVFDTSARAKYERQFSGPDSLMTKWKGDFARAAGSSREISHGIGFTAFSDNNDLHGYGYSLPLTQGDELRITVRSHNPPTKFLIHVYSADSSAESTKSEHLKT